MGQSMSNLEESWRDLSESYDFVALRGRNHEFDSASFGPFSPSFDHPLRVRVQCTNCGGVFSLYDDRSHEHDGQACWRLEEPSERFADEPCIERQRRLLEFRKRIHAQFWPDGHS